MATFIPSRCMWECSIVWYGYGGDTGTFQPPVANQTSGPRDSACRRLVHIKLCILCAQPCRTPTAVPYTAISCHCLYSGTMDPELMHINPVHSRIVHSAILQSWPRSSAQLALQSWSAHNLHKALQLIHPLSFLHCRPIKVG